jgi:hypothetical protein
MRSGRRFFSIPLSRHILRDATRRLIEAGGYANPPRASGKWVLPVTADRPSVPRDVRPMQRRAGWAADWRLTAKLTATALNTGGCTRTEWPVSGRKGIQLTTQRTPAHNTHWNYGSEGRGSNPSRRAIFFSPKNDRRQIDGICSSFWPVRAWPPGHRTARSDPQTLTSRNSVSPPRCRLFTGLPLPRTADFEKHSGARSSHVLQYFISPVLKLLCCAYIFFKSLMHSIFVWRGRYDRYLRK